jgi:hypothetical protein
MNEVRFQFKVLGLCALLAGLMAFVGSTQAGANWVLINSKGELVQVGNPSDILLPEVQIIEIEELKDAKDPGKHLVLLSEVAKVKIAKLCTGMELQNAAGTGAPKLLLGGEVLGKVTFTGCILKINGTTSPACRPHTKGSPEGTVKTELVKGLTKGSSLSITPENSEGKSIESFATIILGAEGAGNECSIGEKLPIIGEILLTDCQELFGTEQASHLMQASASELWVLSKTTEHKMTVDGSALLSLTGEHKGLKWAGV